MAAPAGAAGCVSTACVAGGGSRLVHVATAGTQAFCKLEPFLTDYNRVRTREKQLLKPSFLAPKQLATMGSVVTSLPFVLRFFEMITSIVAFATVADWAGWSKVNYIIFTGVCGLVFALVYMVAYAAQAKAIRGKISTVLDALLVILWLVAAAVSTSILTVDDLGGSRTRASCAFCWITFVLWILSLIISIREMSGYEY